MNLPCSLFDHDTQQMVSTVTQMIGSHEIQVVWEAGRLAPACGTAVTLSIRVPATEWEGRRVMECVATVALVERSRDAAVITLRVDRLKIRPASPQSATVKASEDLSFRTLQSRRRTL